MKTPRKTIQIYIHGVALPNSPGHPGWGAVVIHPDGSKATFSGSRKGPVSHEWGLLAGLVSILEILPAPSEVFVYANSAILCTALKRARRWTRNGTLSQWDKRLDYLGKQMLIAELAKEHPIDAKSVARADWGEHDLEADALAYRAALREVLALPLHERVLVSMQVARQSPGFIPPDILCALAMGDIV